MNGGEGHKQNVDQDGSIVTVFVPVGKNGIFFSFWLLSNVARLDNCPLYFLFMSAFILLMNLDFFRFPLCFLFVLRFF